MGLSAAQARLLSITARLSDNELHSQQIANSKVRLADKTQDASADYINALASQKLMFTTYDAKGNATQTNLTPTVLYTYASEKNQYILKDANGVAFVTSTDAKNYENTDSLIEFLKCYNLTTDEKYQNAMAQYNQDMADYNTKKAKYEQDMADYNNKLTTYENELAAYNQRLEAYNKKLEEYNAAYQEYLEALELPNLYDKFAGFVGTSDNPNNDAGFCYSSALSGNSGCYRHLLAHLLDYGGGYNFNTGVNYQTSYTNPTTGNKETTQIIYTSGGMTSDVKDDAGWLEIVNAINDPTRVCDGDDSYNGDNDETKENLIQAAIDEGRTPTKKEILMSDYLYDEKTNSVAGIKTLKQKAIDLLYILNNSSEITLSAEEMKASLINFTDGDMQNLASPPEEPEPLEPFYGEAPEAPDEPQMPIKPEYSIELNDQDKAQWYVNLWYLMNGSDSANLVKKDSSTDLTGIFIVSATEKNNTGRYKTLEDNLATSSEWIQFALEHGVASIHQAQYIDPTEDNGKAVEINSRGITWTARSYNSCVDIQEVDDEIAVARAEAEYTRKLNEIEAKDKKYDNDIKKLDTEHNALQTEYDSVKSVIEKNIERSFKAFS